MYSRRSSKQDEISLPIFFLSIMYFRSTVFLLHLVWRQNDIRFNAWHIVPKK